MGLKVSLVKDNSSKLINDRRPGTDDGVTEEGRTDDRRVLWWAFINRGPTR